MKLDGLQHAFRGFDINSLDFNTAGNWPIGIKVIAYLLAFSAVIGLGLYFIVADKHDLLQREMQREVEQREEFRRKALQVANLDALRRQMADVEERFSEILAQLPSEQEVPGLLDDISEIGRQAGLEIELIALRPERRAQFYIELPIDIQVKGSYHQMGEFVSGVSAIERIVTLHDFTIAPEVVGRGEQSSRLSMNINAKTYRYDQN